MKPIFILFSALISFQFAFAENWPHWRGPEFNGSTPEKSLPSRWSRTDGLAWVASMPGPSAASPIVWGDRIFISSVDAEEKVLLALCLSRGDGSVLWKKEINQGIQRDNRSNYASPSPVTDGKTVFFFYGNGDLVAFDFSGKLLWQRNLQKDHGDFAFQWTFSTSPTLYKGKLFMQVLQRDVPVNGRGKPNSESFLLALNPSTGETIWKVNRASEAVAESREAFSTPIPHTFEGREELLVAGGDCLTGHDPQSGRELWRWGTWNPTKISHWRLVPSPVAGNGIVLGCAPKGSPVYAIKAGQSGVLPDSAIAWKSSDHREISSDVPTPAFYGGDFFVLSDVRNSLSRVDPKTGTPKWTVELPRGKKFEASPTVADGKVYLINFAGEVVVVDAAKGEIVSTIPMGEERDDLIRSSIAVSNGQLFIRTNQKLFCVGKASQQ